ncbi:Fanconi anemia group E protein isoform X2 [Hyla sarda]|uniref:Fanconi anemia group E protein isoform X2 n=1 Tax=Hyla sarda TaxID=327740 RepID=UPI0024C2B56D|nr:Fanconi anemia group E protein isoform X2 [Hyla sarda]
MFGELGEEPTHGSTGVQKTTSHRRRLALCMSRDLTSPPYRREFRSRCGFVTSGHGTIMESSPLYDCDRVGRLFLQALGTGSNGFTAAYRVLQILPEPFPWNTLLQNLCMKVPSQNGLSGKLILKPKLLQLPIQLQRNLFSILNFVFHLLPTPCIQLLAEMVRTEHYISDDWLLYLTHQFLQNSDQKMCVQRTQVMERLQIFCTGLNWTGGERSKLGQYKQLWDSTQTDCRIQCESEALLEDFRVSTLNIDTEELCTTSQSYNCTEPEEVAASIENEEVPSFIKVHILNLKQINNLEMDSETLDQEYLSRLKNIYDVCNPSQLQTVFSCVGVKHISPKCLFQLCTHLDSISPDLSYAHAESLASILFLEQVLSLSAPASRTLTAALSVFCRKYAWPACNILITPLLAKAETGSLYADFLCRMISECLDKQELYLCFDPIFKVPCSEVSVSVLHMLVDKKEKLNQSEFDLLLNHLGHAAEKFSKSMAFSKLLLVLLTSKKNLVQPSHIGLLTNSLNSNQTFMKKSLQNALKKVHESFK